jgi:hypothetical protein
MGLRMDSEAASPLFVYLSFPEGELLLNLNQIVFVRDISAEEVTLELSSGKTITIHDAEPVTRILALIAQHSVVPEGTPLAQFFLEREKMH